MDPNDNLPGTLEHKADLVADKAEIGCADCIGGWKDVVRAQINYARTVMCVGRTLANTATAI
jgi:hypothetical protein